MYGKIYRLILVFIINENIVICKDLCNILKEKYASLLSDKVHESLLYQGVGICSRLAAHQIGKKINSELQ